MGTRPETKYQIAGYRCLKCDCVYPHASKAEECYDSDTEKAQKIVKFLKEQENPQKALTLDEAERIAEKSFSMDFYRSMEREGLIQILPFPQGKEMFISLPR